MMSAGSFLQTDLYHLPHLVYGRRRFSIRHPDFTLPNHKVLRVEYAGMPDIPEYMTGIRHKQRAYGANNKPALFIYPDDLEDPYGPERVVNWYNLGTFTVFFETTLGFQPQRGSGLQIWDHADQHL